MGKDAKTGVGDPFTPALNQARDRLNEALREQAGLEGRAEALKAEITKLRRVISGLADLCGQPPEPDGVGITAACDAVLANATYLMTTRQVMDRLEQMGFSLDGYRNPAASVGAVLQRLNSAGKIKRISTEDRLYWKGPSAQSELLPGSTVHLGFGTLGNDVEEE